MGLRTWIYRNTGIKLKKIEAPQPSIQHGVPVANNKNYEDLLQEVRELKGILSNLSVTASVSNLAPDLQTTERWRFPNLLEKVTDIELQGCIELIRKHLSHAYLAPTDFAIREYCLKQIPLEGMLLEFGVFKGTSINHIAKTLSNSGDQRIIHGFDSFKGLSHDGVGWVWEKGRFNIEGLLPKVESNVILHKGWIDDTLPLFLTSNPEEKIAFIHVDVDIYEPAKTILTLCKNRLKPGSIIIFDELIGYAGWRFHEYKALCEVFDNSEFEYIAFSDKFQAAIRIK